MAANDSPDYIVDIGTGGGAGRARPNPRRAGSGNASQQGRPWLSVRWRCCGQYSRIYRNRTGTAYAGNCPRCGKPVRIKIGPGGTNHRLFEAW